MLISMIAWKYLTVTQLFYFYNNKIFKRENNLKNFKMLVDALFHDMKKHKNFNTLC